MLAALGGLGRPGPSAYHRLNPLTKATSAAVATLGAFLLGGYLAPTLLLAGLVLPGAFAARLLGRALRLALVVSLPIAVSVALVSVFTRAGTTVLFSVGPFDATAEGVDFAGRVVVRLAAVAAALALFGLTTEPRALVVDLERRGLSPRLTFAVAAALDAIPRMVERAVAITAAQRARGLDTESGLVARSRGVLPLVGPVILSSLTEVEQRSLALDARAFGRPGPRQLLWSPPDSGRQRAVRWLLVLGLLAVLGGRLVGALPELP